MLLFFMYIMNDMGNVLFGVNFDSVIQDFDIDRPKLLWVKSVGPDEILGKAVDASGNRYVLWGRDYLSGLKSDAVDLRLLFGITIDKWILPRDRKGIDDLDNLDVLDYLVVTNVGSVIVAKIKSWHPNSRRFRGRVTYDTYRYGRWA